MYKTTRTLLFSTLLAAAPLALAGTALAGPGHAGPGGFGADPAMSAERQLAGTIRRLDLSADQEAAIRDLFEDNREDLEANRQASRAVREDVQALLAADTLDDEALADLARREGELAEERVLLSGTLAAQVLAELNDDQRAELQALRSEREQRRRERFGARSERRRQVRD